MLYILQARYDSAQKVARCISIYNVQLHNLEYSLEIALAYHKLNWR